MTIAGDLIDLFDKSLNDEAIVKLPSDTLALKILRGLRIGVNQAKIAVAVLFPDPLAGGVTTAGAVKIASWGIKRMGAIAGTAGANPERFLIVRNEAGASGGAVAASLFVRRAALILATSAAVPLSYFPPCSARPRSQR